MTLFLVAAVPLGAGALRLGRRPPAAGLARLGGLIGAAGGALWMLAWWLVADEWSENPWVFVCFIAAGALALGVVGLASAGRPGRLGWAGLVPAFLGAVALGLALVLSEWFEWEAGWLLMMIGLLGHTLGLTIFGLANLKKRLLPRFRALPLFVGAFGGPVPLLASALAGDNADWPLVLMVAMLGLGWMALGFSVWAPARPGSAEELA